MVLVPLVQSLLMLLYWSLQIQKFYTAPTLIRALMREGDDHVTGSDTSSLQVLGTVGEPINPEAWKWYHRVSTSLLLHPPHTQTRPLPLPPFLLCPPCMCHDDLCCKLGAAKQQLNPEALQAMHMISAKSLHVSSCPNPLGRWTHNDPLMPYNGLSACVNSSNS